MKSHQTYYESNKILGRLFRTLRGKMDLLIRSMGEPEGGFVLDPRVTRILDRFSGHQHLDVTRRMETALSDYMADKAEFIKQQETPEPSSKEETEKRIGNFVYWKLQYSQEKRKEVMNGNDYYLMKPALIAAVLYKVGLEREEKFRKERQESLFGGPMEFVWNVVGNELCRDVFGDQENSILVDRNVERAFMGKT